MARGLNSRGINYLFIGFSLFLFIFGLTNFVSAASADDPVVAIENITEIKGVRDNYLSGFGLVIGLAGTGDSNRYQPTIQSHANMLKKFGINVTPKQIQSRNLAAVIVTAKLPPFAHSGEMIDVTISSIGDAKSLQGGTLFMTALYAPNGDIYAVAQGPISIGGFNFQQGGSRIRKNHATVATIPNGAIVERELKAKLDHNVLSFLLDQPNAETAKFIAQAINDYFKDISGGKKLAKAIDFSEVEVRVPDKYRDDLVNFIAMVNNLEVRSSMEAKVIINERTGTIVMGHNVRISTVSVAHGNLTVKITSNKEVSQPESFSSGQTVTTTNTEIELGEEEGHLMVVKNRGTISDLVAALNAIGATPRDIIAIIQDIKAAGALHAKIELI